ncbi:Dolichol kinase [Dirofilaria immitis]|nr:Dolichol kinase [Dirofilaria immitis]
MEKIDSTDPMLSTEKQLHVEVTNEDKPLQPLSTSTSLIPSADVKYDEIKLDNLPSHQKHIMNRLESIRENKQRILATLRELKENTKEGEFPNKELMSKMIGSYDALTAQEEQYVQLMQKIVNLRENAADDVQHENEKISDESSRRGNVMQDGNAESNNKLSAEEIDNDVEEMNSELSKLGVVTGKAVAVSIMNDKLLETLQLHHEKKAALEELHRRKQETQKGIANEALQQVEMARLKTNNELVASMITSMVDRLDERRNSEQSTKNAIFASEQEQVERKRKTLERLRREAQRRGIKLGPGSASEPDIVVEPQPEPKSITEAKLRAKLQAKKKQNTELEDDTGPPVPDDLAPAERIPPVLENEIEQQQQMEGKISEITGGNGCVGKKREKKQSDTINSSIREKLAAIAARKERMREIRAQLAKPVEESPPDMDETFRNALQQLKSITEMRKQLELLREKGAELPEETAELLERQLEAEENASKENEIKAPNEMDANYNFETPFEESAQALEEQRQLLETIASQNHQHQSSLPITTESCQTRIAILRKCFLTAKPQLLIHLGNILLDLAKRQLRNDLDSVLRDILQNSNDGQLPNEIDKHQNDVNDDNHELASIESESHEAVELIKFIHTESANRFERGLSRELTPDEVSKFEQAKRHLSSGLENDICTIIDGILPLIRQHSELNADDGFMRQLRDELLRQASVVCFPENATPTDLFRNQLSTIIDDTLSQYVGNKVGEIFRSKSISPWSKYLNSWLLIFIDKQDSLELILTPIYLLIGIFLLIFLSPINNNESRHLYHFAGIATVGIGDSLSAIIGSLYGRLHWPRSRKTIEGSCAFAIGQFIFYF